MTAYYHYSRQGRNTMSYDDGKYAFGVDDFGWDLTPPPEDFGYGLGWAALGETLGDDDGCEAARAIGHAIESTEEMVAVRLVLRHLAIRCAMDAGAPTRDVMRLLGLPEVVIDWVMSA